MNTDRCRVNPSICWEGIWRKRWTQAIHWMKRSGIQEGMPALAGVHRSQVIFTGIDEIQGEIERSPADQDS
jgi:hypothetical protein